MVGKRCGTELADALTGRAQPPELLFPLDAWDNMTHFYSHSVAASKCNDALRSSVQKLLQRCEKPLRILEIGARAGTGE